MNNPNGATQLGQDLSSRS